MSYSVSLRLNYQPAGANLNTWGLVLNDEVFQRLEDAVAGSLAFTLSGSKTLIVANDATDEAHFGTLNITSGSGGTITAPAVKKTYLVRNGASGAAVITAGGVSVSVPAGQTFWVWCDGADFRLAVPTDFNSVRLKNIGSPVNDYDAATKLYVDNQAWAAVSGDFPGQTGNAGNVLYTDATNPYWAPALPAPSRKTANFTAADKGRYPIDTTSGAVTVLMPASPAEGAYFQAWDGGVTLSSNGWATNKVTFSRNGSTINGIADDVECNTRGAALSFEFVNGTWSIRLGC